MNCNKCKSLIKTDKAVFCAKHGNRQISIKFGEDVPKWCPKKIKGVKGNVN